MKSNIRQRVFRLVLSSSVITFIVLAAVLIIGMLAIRYNLNERSTALSEYSTNYIQNVMMERSKGELERLAKSKAEHINSELTEQVWDARYLSNGMNRLLSAPLSDISRLTLPNATYQTVLFGEAYLYYTPALLQQGISAAVAEEIDRTCNISDLIVPFMVRYKDYMASFTIASDNGFWVCAETSSAGGKIIFSEDYFTTYDFRKRPWYLAGKNITEPVFTDVYVDTDGKPVLSCVTSYYDGGGNFAGVISIAYDIQDIYKIVFNTAVGLDGFSFVLEESGNVIISPKKDGIFSPKEENFDLRQLPNFGLAEVARRMTAGETGVVSIVIGDEEYYLAFAPIPSSSWSFGTVMSRSTVLAPAIAARNELQNQMEDFRSNIAQLFLKIFIGAVVVLALLLAWMFVGSSRVSKRFVEPINKLSDGVREISGGNFDKKLEITTGDEIEELANNFNTMTDNLKTYMANLEKVTAAEERIATELKVATNIQLGALPHDFLEDNTKFEIYATMHAAKEVGGDFYDFYLLDSNHLMVTIADVSGKGVPAALFMMRGKTILKNLAMTMQSPDDLAAVMALANNQLCQGNDEMMFITVFVALLDLNTGKLIYVNGGHNPPMIYRDTEKKFSWLDMEQNCVLGLMDEMDFEQQETQLNRGDIIYLYTDGVTEAMNENREQYGEARLEKCLNAIDHQCKLQTLLEGVKESLGEHVQDAEQSDDITMLAVRLK